MSEARVRWAPSAGHAIVMAAVMLASGVQAAPSECNRKVATQSGETNAYQRRDDGRCEGFFQQPISVTGIEIVGLQYGAPLDQSKLGDATSLPLLPAALPDDSGLQIIGRSLDPDIYYQIDARSDASEPFDWSLESVRSLDNAASIMPLCFIACEGDCRQRQPAYRPVRVEGIDSDELTLILQARVALAKVFYRLTPASAEHAGHNDSIDLGRFPPRRPVVIGLPGDIDGGVYTLVVHALTTDGQADQVSATVYVP